MTRQIQNKLKKVAKGLSKASKTHAKQAKTIQSVLKTKKKKVKLNGSYSRNYKKEDQAR